MLKDISFICKYVLVRDFCPEMSRYQCLNTATRSAWWQWYPKQGGTTLELNLKPLRPHMFPLCAISVRSPGCDPAISACCIISTPTPQMQCLKACETLEEWSCGLYATHLAGLPSSSWHCWIQAWLGHSAASHQAGPHRLWVSLPSLSCFYCQGFLIKVTQAEHHHCRKDQEKSRWGERSHLSRVAVQMREKDEEKEKTAPNAEMPNMKWAEKEREYKFINPHSIPTTSPCGVRGLHIKEGERCLEWSQGILP